MLKTVKKKRSNTKRKKNSFLERVEELAGYGLTIQEIATVLDFNEQKLNRCKKDPLFHLAMKKGRIKADADIIEALFKRATGFEHDDLHVAQSGGEIITQEIKKHYPPDTAAIIYWLNNRKSGEWKRKQETDGDLSNEEISKLKSIALNEAKEKI